MWISSPKLIKYAFMVSGIIIVIILGILALSMNGKDSNSRRIEKLQELQERSDVIIIDDGAESGSITVFVESGIGWDYDSNKIPKVNVGDNIIICTCGVESFPILDIKE